MREVRIGHCVDVLRQMEAGSVQCIVTSPPYWGLRRYDGQQEAIWPRLDAENPDCNHEWERGMRPASKRTEGRPGLNGGLGTQRSGTLAETPFAFCRHCGAWRGPFGLDPMPELYVEHTIYVLREIRRVLRHDGVVWLNLGDTFFGSWGNYGARNGKQRTRRKERYSRDAWEAFTGRPPMAGTHTILKPKDLCAIPFRVALAAQADGWWLRSVVVWDKPNAMPESVKDRPTESHEYVILLAKSERYFYDADAVREPHQEVSVERAQRRWAVNSKYDDQAPQHLHSWMRDRSNMRRSCHPVGRNMRTVWRFATYPYPGAHFAVFPPELPRRCILAGSPPKACATCGAPWERIIERDEPVEVPEVGPNSGELNKPPYQQNNPHRMRLETAAREEFDGQGDSLTPEDVALLKYCGGTGRDGTGYEGEARKDYAGAKAQNPSDVKRRILKGMARRMKTANQDRGGKRLPPEPGEPNAFYTGRTVGWQPTCECHGKAEAVTSECADCGGSGGDAQDPCLACGGTGTRTTRVWPEGVLEDWPTRPAIVLDPFAGSGTTLMVAEELGRWWIGIDICEDYLPQIRKRTAQRSLAGAFENATH